MSSKAKLWESATSSTFKSRDDAHDPESEENVHAGLTMRMMRIRYIAGSKKANLKSKALRPESEASYNLPDEMWNQQ
jgi:hypothetical protein